MKIRVTYCEKEVLRPAKLPKIVVEYDMEDFDQMMQYTKDTFKAHQDERNATIEKIEETDL